MDFSRAVNVIGNLIGGLGGLLGRGSDTSKLSGQIHRGFSAILTGTKLLTEAARDQLSGRLSSLTSDVFRQASKTRGEVARRARGIVQDIAAVAQIAQAIRGQTAGSAVEGDVRDATRPILDIARTIIPTITRQLTGDTRSILASTNGIQRTIQDNHRALPGIIGDVVTGLIPDIVGSLVRANTGPGGAITGAIQGVGDRIGQLLNPILGIIDTITQVLRASGLGGLADKLQNVSSSLSTVHNALDGHLRLIEDVAGTVTGTLGRMDSETAAEIYLSNNIFRRQATAQNLIAESLSASGPVGQLVASFSDMTNSAGQRTLPRRRSVKPTDAPCLDGLDDIIEQFSDVPIVGNLIAAFTNILATWGAIAGTAGIKAEWCRLAYLRANPHQPASPPDVIAQWLRQLINDGDARKGLRQWGYDSDEARRMLEAALQPLPPESVLEAVRRKVLTEDQGTEELRRGGLSLEDAQRVMAMRTYVLPPQDIIRLAVREVFSPDQRSAGQLDADYPAVLTERAEEAGMSERDARDLWAAHWELPSIRQGVEMLHRGVIDAETYRALQRARDVAPAWRDRLTAIQYSPITRVDLRRLHAEGAIDDERMLRGYTDIGYSPEDAELMASWTKQRTQAAIDRATTTDAEGLTRSGIVRLYRLGAIQRARAVSLLTERGISQDAADGYLEAADMELAADAREDRLQAILARARAGSVSESAARNEINALDLESAERELANAKLDQVIAGRTKVPSRADLDRAAKAGLVGESEYLAALVDQGWSVDWARRFWRSRPGQGVEQ